MKIPYWPLTPGLKQEAAITALDEVFFFGLAAGGKSEALAMNALLGVVEPSYKALIIRPEKERWMLPGTILERFHSEFPGLPRDHMFFRFPSGASITFGWISTYPPRFFSAPGKYDFIGIEDADELPIEDYLQLRMKLRSSLTSKSLAVLDPNGPYFQDYVDNFPGTWVSSAIE